MKCDIYMIMNVKDNKVYIGQSVNMRRRIRNHKDLLKRNKHFSLELQSDWNKHGEKGFLFNILERLESDNKDIFNERETFWTVFYRENTSCEVYNINNGRYLSEGTKKKLREANLGDKNPKYWLGKKRPEETRLKISKSHIGLHVGENHPMWGKEGYWNGKQRPEEFSLKVSKALKGHTVSDEAKKKMSEAKKGKDPHNKFPLTPELLEDISNGISYKDFEAKYGKSKNTLKRIKQELAGKPPRVRKDRK